MSSRIDLLVEIATLYYEKGLTQTEIAKRKNLSRPTIAKLLQEAKDEGIVKITIQYKDSNLIMLQENIKQKYDLKNCLIASGKTEDTKAEVGKLCADFVENRLDNIRYLGIGWGTTVYEYVNHASYHYFNNLTIIPLIGGFDFTEIKIHSNHLAFTLAQKYHCDVRYFYAPAITRTLEEKELFIQSELVESILNLGKNVDMAIVGVGNPIKSSTYRKLGYIKEEDAKELEKHHSVGDIGATFFNEEGESIQTNISNRMIGITLHELKNVPELVVLATGVEKKPSIKALLKQNVIDHLIIDEALASNLL